MEPFECCTRVWSDRADTIDRYMVNLSVTSSGLNESRLGGSLAAGKMIACSVRGEVGSGAEHAFVPSCWPCDESCRVHLSELASASATTTPPAAAFCNIRRDGARCPSPST